MVSVPSRGSRLSNKLGGCMEVEIYFGFRPLAGFKVIQLGGQCCCLRWDCSRGFRPLAGFKVIQLLQKGTDNA